MKIAICDDLKNDREILKTYLVKYFASKNEKCDIQIFESGDELLSKFINEKFDLILLDIYMRGKLGIDVAKEIKSIDEKCNIIFTTTSVTHGMDSYEVEAFYYLVKPIKYQKFSEVMNKFIDTTFHLKSVNVQIGRHMTRVFLNDIIYMEASKKKVIIHTKAGDFETSTSLSKLGRMLPNADFYKPIRYAIVSMRKIKAVIGEEIVLSNDFRLPVSRNEKDKFKEAFAEFKWRKIRNRD